MNTEKLETIRQNVIVWINRLPEFKKGRQCLYDSYEQAFCCLGVATQLKRDITKFKMYLYLQKEEQDAYGLRTEDGEFFRENWQAHYGSKSTREHPSLAILNDGGISFGDIADLIRSIPSGLFIPEVESYLREKGLN